MNRECRENVEAKMKERFLEKIGSDYKDFDAKLEGYGFAISGSKLESIFSINYTGTVMVPKKNGGGMKKERVRHSVVANFCPICGKSTKTEES